MIATQTLVVEKRLEEIFCYLPEMTSLSGGTNHPVRFGYGDKKELNSFLKNRSLDKVYPLIWLLYPYTENHSNTDVEVTNATFILAMSTNAQMENKERIEKTFGKVLLPLFYTKRFVTNKGTHEVGSIYYPTNEKLLENLINTKRIEKCQ